MRRSSIQTAALAMLLAACPSSGPEGGSADSGGSSQDAARFDAGHPDGATSMCVGPADCDDGVFCNGQERCSPSTPGADVRGCLAASDPACPSGQTCNETNDRCDPQSCTGAAADADGDGARAVACGGGDCDDNDPERRPDANEICDSMSRDEDCDETTFGFRDADNDGAASAACCNVGAGGSTRCGTDCDDMAPGVHPTATETCNGIDDDCDTRTDENVMGTFTIDGDGDGFGAIGGATMQACRAPMGYAEMATDCDDTRNTVHPAAGEICDRSDDGGMPLDENCNGEANPSSLCRCTLGDSQPCMQLGDCSQGSQLCESGMWGACSIGPSPEQCNGEDDDCNGIIDDRLRVTCFADRDNDGYPGMGAAESLECPVAGRESVGGCPTGYTDRAPMGSDIDCEDGLAAVRPGAREECNASMVDENCNGMVDEGVAQTCYDDADGDGYAPMGATGVSRCIDTSRPDGCPFGTTARAPTNAMTSDCNDMALTARPGGTEQCDGMLDENCSGMVDEGCTCVTGSTRACPQPGICAMGIQSCAAGAWGACSVAPVPEVCNTLDDNCNGAADEGVAQTCYTDADDDRYAPAGATGTTRSIDGTRPGGCPIGFTDRRPANSTTTDCNDGAMTARPGATEICEGMLDESCDGRVDEGCTCTNGDTRSCPQPGACAMGIQNCAIGTWGACSISPANDICNGADDDCDSRTDETVAQPCYPDGDNDGFALAGATSTQRCIVAGRPDGCPIGTTARAPIGMANTDCNDTATQANPGGTEVCDGAAIDEDCDGTPNEGCSCSNGATRACPQPGVCGMGLQSCTGGAWGSCSIAPTPEVCNTLDDNCNGMTDEGVLTACWVDGDGDGYALATAMRTEGCTMCGVGRTARAPSGPSNTDCDDARVGVHPNATEVCDGRDTDCSTGMATAIPAEDGDGDMHTLIGYTGCSGGYPKDDCHDGNANVFTGQQTYFTDGYCPVGYAWCPDCGRCINPSSSFCESRCTGDVTSRVFDYNCDGVTSRQPSGTNSCMGGGTCFGFPSCDDPHYYYTGTPTCGTPVTYWPCGCGGVMCTTGPATTRGLACR